MKAYSYDPETKQYAGEIECQLDPLETRAQGHDVWLLPGDSTWEEPLPEKEGYYVVWDGEDWQYEKIPEPPEPPEPTEDEMKTSVRAVRDGYLAYWDFTQLFDAPFTEDEKEKYREYRQYLRDYTKEENWWLQDPDDFATWLLVHYPVTN